MLETKRSTLRLERDRLASERAIALIEPWQLEAEGTLLRIEQAGLVEERYGRWA